MSYPRDFLLIVQQTSILSVCPSTSKIYSKGCVIRGLLPPTSQGTQLIACKESIVPIGEHLWNVCTPINSCHS